MAKFWIVWNEATAQVESTQHQDLQSAINEAITLSQSNAGKFEVLEALGEAAPVVTVTYTPF